MCLLADLLCGQHHQYNCCNRKKALWMDYSSFHCSTTLAGKWKIRAYPSNILCSKLRRCQVLCALCETTDAVIRAAYLLHWSSCVLRQALTLRSLKSIRQMI